MLLITLLGGGCTASRANDKMPIAIPEQADALVNGAAL